jgi:hypothetical protein
MTMTIAIRTETNRGPSARPTMSGTKSLEVNLLPGGRYGQSRCPTRQRQHLRSVARPDNLPHQLSGHRSRSMGVVRALISGLIA